MKETQTETVQIKAPNFAVAKFKIRGLAPLVINAFPQKAREIMRAKHEAGSTAKGKKAREARDFTADFNGARHISREGWDGFAASSIRNACISACRLVNFKMTLAKLSVFVVADGYDRVDGVPLVKITKGEPEQAIHPTRNATGVVDLRSRAMWREGWEADVSIRFDADQFTMKDVANLLARVGAQVGIGEGRPDSKASAGMGWGTFELVEGK